MTKKNLLIAGSLIILSLFCWAFFLRIYNLGTQSWWMDEGYAITTAKAMIQHGYPLLESGIVSEPHQPYLVILAKTIEVFGLSPTTSRVPSVVFNILAIGIAGLFAVRFFGRQTGLLATTFLLFSYWEIAWARQARPYAAFQLFFWIALFLFWSFLFTTEQKKKILYFIGCAIFSTLAFLTHQLGILLVPIYLLGLLYHSFSKRSSLLISIALLMGSVFLTSNQLHNALITHNITPVFYLPKYLSFLRESMLPTILLAILPLLSRPEEDRERRKKIVLLWWSFLIYLSSLSFLLSLLNYRYLFPVLPILYILAAEAMVWLSRQWPKIIHQRYIKKYGLVPLIGAYMLLSPEFQLLPISHYTLESDPVETKGYHVYTPQPNWYDAYLSISQKKKKDDIIISTQPVFTRLYFDEKGYWLAHSLRDGEAQPEVSLVEQYTGAVAVTSGTALANIIENSHGFIVVDQLALDGRLKAEIVQMVQRQSLLYFHSFNQYSRIWVYEF